MNKKLIIIPIIMMFMLAMVPYVLADNSCTGDEGFNVTMDSANDLWDGGSPCTLGSGELTCGNNKNSAIVHQNINSSGADFNITTTLKIKISSATNGHSAIRFNYENTSGTDKQLFYLKTDDGANAYMHSADAGAQPSQDTPAFIPIDNSYYELKIVQLVNNSYDFYLGETYQGNWWGGSNAGKSNVSNFNFWNEDFAFVIDYASNKCEVDAIPPDTTPPEADSISINNTNPNLNRDIQTSVNVTDTVGIVSVFQADNLSGVFLNKTSINLSEPSTQIELNYSTNFTNTLRFGQVVGVTYTFNDTSGNSGQAFLNYTVGDTVPPIADSIAINVSLLKLNQDFQMSVNITDESAISSAFFAHNISGILTNITSINLTGVQTELNFSVNLTNTLRRALDVGGVFTFNDAAGNSGQTFLNYTVDGLPRITSLAINNTNPYENKDVMINISVVDDIGISSIFVENNATGEFLNITSTNITGETSVAFSFNETSSLGVVSYRFFVNDTAGQVVQVQDFLVDDLIRQDSNSLGSATNGNVWVENRENEPPGSFSLFKILSNLLLSSTESVAIGDAANATLDLMPVLDKDNSEIGFLFQSLNNNRGGTVMSFLQGGETIFTLFSSGATAGSSCLANKTGLIGGEDLADYCRYNFTENAERAVRDMMFEFDFTRGKVHIQLNDTGDVMVNFSATMVKSDATQIDAIQVGPSQGTSAATIIFKYDSINYTRPGGILSYESVNTPPEAPTIILPINDDYNNTATNYPFNVTFPADVDEEQSLTIQYYINGVLNQTSLTNTTFNASDGVFVLNVSLFDGIDSGPNSTVNFTIDTTVPTLALFNLTNNTKFGFNENLTMNITIQDSNPFNLTFNFHNKSDDRIYFSYNDEKNSSTTISIVDTLNLTALGSGNYTLDINFSDRHTNSKIKDYKVKNVYNGVNFLKATGLNFETAEGSDITIQQTTGQQARSVEYEKLIDRYTIGFGTVQARETRTFTITAESKIEIIKGTKYKGHLIIGNKNWMDFENGDADSKVTVRRLSDTSVVVTVNSNNFQFNSVGGLNVVDVFYNFQVDNDPPFFQQQSINDTRPDVGEVIDVSFVCEDAVELGTCWIATNQSGVWKNITNTSFASATTSFNQTLNLTVTAVAGTVVGTEGFANDSFNQFGSSGIFTFTVNETTSPELNLTFNVTTFHANQSINISVNSSDNFELDSGIITVAEPGLVRFFNFSLESTASNTFYQNITMPNELQQLVNVTAFVNDSFGNSVTTTTRLPITKDLLVTALNIHGNTSITSFTAAIFNSTYSETKSTTTGSITFSEVTTGLFDVNMTSEENGSYINITIFNYNVTENLEAPMYQTITYFTAVRRGTGVNVTDFRVEAPLTDNQSNSTGGARLFLNQTNYEIGSFSDDYFDTITRINLSTTSQNNVVVEFSDINLSISILSLSNNTYLNNFEVTLSGNDSSFTESLTSTAGADFDGNVTFSLGNGTYEAIVDADGHALFSNKITILSNETLQNITFSVTAADSVTFNLLDEITDEPIESNGSITIVSDDFATNITLNGTNFFIQDLIPGDYRFTYDALKYTKRDFYGSVLNATNQTIKLYLLSTGNGTDVEFTVQDNSGNELSNSTIRLKRYFITTNSYRTVAMAQTNQEGKASIDVDFNDAFYETLTTFKEFSLRTLGAKIIRTTFILTLALKPDPLETIEGLNNIDTSLTFNNVTETFSYVFTDLKGVPRTGTIVVVEITPTSEIVVCTNTDTSVSGTVLCQYNTTNATGTYVATGSIRIGSEYVPTDRYDLLVGILKTKFRDIIGNQGIFVSILVAGTLGGLGAVVSPAVGIIMFLVGLVMTTFFGLNIIILSLLVSFIILGGIIIYKMKSR